MRETETGTVDWYYVRDDVQAGPIGEAEFQALVQQGVVAPDTSVWHDGMTDWRPYGEVQPPDVAPAAPPLRTRAAPGHACAECGRVFPEEDMVQYGDAWVCAACKPVFFQRLSEGAVMPMTVRYGGFWIRFVAKVIDGILLGIVGFAIQAAIAALVEGSGEELTPAVLAVTIGATFAQLILRMVYVTWFVGKYGATPGKMACGLKIVRADGSKVGYLRAFGRFFAEMLSALIIYIGYIMAGFDDEKRALHDHICDTRVVYK